MSDRRSKDISLSKTLSWLLRHGAIKEGLPISSDGFIAVSTILNHKSLKGKCNLTDLEHIVKTNDKQRFTLRTSEGVLEIKANQGHSLKEIEDHHLVPILNANCVKNVIHGTYHKFWDKIKEIGLSRMNRNHIHFATNLSSTSGIRKNADIYIYINIEKALSNNIKFYQSANGVILSPGNTIGIIEPNYFLKVCKIDGTLIDF